MSNRDMVENMFAAVSNNLNIAEVEDQVTKKLEATILETYKALFKYEFPANYLEEIVHPENIIAEGGGLTLIVGDFGTRFHLLQKTGDNIHDIASFREAKDGIAFMKKAISDKNKAVINNTMKTALDDATDRASAIVSRQQSLPLGGRND